MKVEGFVEGAAPYCCLVCQEAQQPGVRHIVLRGRLGLGVGQRICERCVVGMANRLQNAPCSDHDPSESPQHHSAAR